MNDFPSWWLWLSAIFFAVNILLFATLVVAIVMMMRLVAEMKPKVAALEQNVQSLIGKVHDVAEKVEEVATSVKSTVDNVGARAKGVAGSAEIVAHSASKQFQRYSPYLIGAVTALRLITAVRQFKEAKQHPAEAQAKNKVRQAVRVGRGLVKTILHLTSR